MPRFFVGLTFALGSFTAFAGTDAKPHLSPDGRHSIHNVGDTAFSGYYFEIRSREGEVLLTTDDKEWKTWLPTHASDIKWSSDSRFVLFCYDDGKYRATALYSFAERKLINLSHVTDGWTVPIRWVSSRTFVVEHAGPRGGKPRGGGYHQRETYRIRSQPLRLDCVYSGPTITKKDDPE